MMIVAVDRMVGERVAWMMVEGDQWRELVVVLVLVVL